MTEYNSESSDLSSSFFQPNTMIGKYRIIEKIHSGGMGDIYHAQDSLLERKVVLKFITCRFSDEDKYKEMLLNEAKIASGLKHDNIVTIYEVFKHNNQPVVVMEYIEGSDLKKLSESDKLSANDSVSIIEQIASALSYAHSMGVIHKDIKASNIVVDQKGKAKILDFGLACRLDDTVSDHADDYSGTLCYMSPEQINDGAITPQSDLFSLGVVFYQLLTGQLPFSGDYTAALKYSILNETPTSPDTIDNFLDSDLSAIVMKLLERDVNKRYRSADELLQDLNGWNENKSDSKVTGSKKKKKTIIPIAIIAAAAVVVVVLLKIIPNTTSSGPVTLAVLPFENLGNADDNYFADGMTDALTMNLAKVKDIEIRSQNSSMQYKDSKLSSGEIGEQLNVRYLLTGRIHWDNNSDRAIRIYSALIDNDKDSYIWTYEHEVAANNFFKAQSDISKDIVKALSLVLTEHENKMLEQLPTTKIDAYIMYSRGFEYFNRSWDESDVDIALDMFKKVVEIDPDYSLAYAMISRCYASMYWDHYESSPQICANSKEYAERAISFENKYAESYLALGYYYYHCEQNYDTALTIFDRGLKDFPNNADLYNAVAAVQRRIGPLEESVKNFKKAFALDPRSHLKAMDIALTYGMLRQQDSATFYIEKSIELAPDYSLAHIYDAWLPIITNGDIKTAKEKIKQGLKVAELKESKYYWWLLRVIDPAQEMVYEYKKTPGTDSLSYYLYMAQHNRLNHDHETEIIYADSALKKVEPKLKQNPSDAYLNMAAALAYAGLRNKEKAVQLGVRALELANVSREAMDAPFIVLDYAEVMLIFGEKETAFDQLKYLLSIPGFVTPVYFQTDPLWKPIFDDTLYSKQLP